MKSSTSIIVEGDLKNMGETYKMSIKENNLIFTLDRSPRVIYNKPVRRIQRRLEIRNEISAIFVNPNFTALK